MRRLHPEPGPPPRLLLLFGFLCSGYTALLFSGKAQLPPTLPFECALPEYSATSPFGSSPLATSPLIKCIFSQRPFWPSHTPPNQYTWTHRFSTRATYPSHLGHLKIADAQRLILLVWVSPWHQYYPEQPGTWITGPAHSLCLVHSHLSLCLLVVCVFTRVEPGLGLSCALLYP